MKYPVIDNSLKSDKTGSNNNSGIPDEFTNLMNVLPPIPRKWDRQAEREHKFAMAEAAEKWSGEVGLADKWKAYDLERGALIDKGYYHPFFTGPDTSKGIERLKKEMEEMGYSDFVILKFPKKQGVEILAKNLDKAKYKKWKEADDEKWNASNTKKSQK